MQWKDQLQQLQAADGEGMRQNDVAARTTDDLLKRVMTVLSRIDADLKGVSNSRMTSSSRYPVQTLRSSHYFRRAGWNFQSWAKDLTHCPLLVIGASKAYGEENRRLADAVTRAGGKVAAITLPSDHSFQDHRIALAAEVVVWLQKLTNS